MGNPLVLDDAAQLQAELDRAESQSGTAGLEGDLDDAADLFRRLIELGLMVGLTGGADFIDADADFRLPHQEGAALLGALAEIPPAAPPPPR